MQTFHIPFTRDIFGQPGLPDGILFAYKKSQFWYILEGLGIENLGRYILWSFCIHILRSFCKFLVHVVYFCPFGMLYQEKSGNTVDNAAF
jgi:hypothetical protein